MACCGRPGLTLPIDPWHPATLGLVFLRRRSRGLLRMVALPLLYDYSRTFKNIIVYPSQELLRHPTGPLFRGGPAWPFFETQIYARTCWRPIPWPVDSRPHRSDQPVEQADRGIWCGPISHHFGHMVAD